MADETVPSRRDSGPEEDGEVVREEAATAPQNLSKRQMKKLLKQQKWEEERELRK